MVSSATCGSTVLTRLLKSNISGSSAVSFTDGYESKFICGVAVDNSCRAEMSMSMLLAELCRRRWAARYRQTEPSLWLKSVIIQKKKKSCREQKNRAETQTWHCWHCCCPSPAGTVSKYRDSTTRTKNTASLSASTTFAGPLSPGNLVWYLELLCSASIDEQRARQFRAHGHSSCLAQLGGLMLVAPMLNLIRSLAMFFIFYFVMKGKRT